MGPSNPIEGYHFADKTVMEKEIKDGKFLEFASVHANLYGTSIESVERYIYILDIDVQGAKSVRASSLDATFIFVCPPSMKVLEDQLRARGTSKFKSSLEMPRQRSKKGNHRKLLGLDASTSVNGLLPCEHGSVIGSFASFDVHFILWTMRSTTECVSSSTTTSRNEHALVLCIGLKGL